MGLNTDLKRYWYGLTIAEKTIVVNVLIFVFVQLIPFLFVVPLNSLLSFVELSQSVTQLLYQPWTLITYAFIHVGFYHLFWNMVLLWSVSKLFLNLFNKDYFVKVYAYGIVFGGLLYLIAYQLFPAFVSGNTSLIGASAAVMAIFVFIATYRPSYSVRLLFVNVKLGYVAAAVVFFDVIQIPTENAGGHIAHLGGAIFGYLYAKQLAKGREFSLGVRTFLKKLVSAKSPLKTVHKTKTTSNSSQSVAAGERQKKIDAILDKISHSGYESLSKAEKDFLFRAGKE